MNKLSTDEVIQCVITFHSRNLNYYQLTIFDSFIHTYFRQIRIDPIDKSLLLNTLLFLCNCMKKKKREFSITFMIFSFFISWVCPDKTFDSSFRKIFVVFLSSSE